MASSSTTRVAIIGIGSAGLASLKQTVDAFARPEAKALTNLEVIGFEARDNVGGLWNYDHDPKAFIQREVNGQLVRYPEHGENPTPFYENLRATLPGDLMAFRDHTFDSDIPLVPWGEQLLTYLESYAEKYDLRQHVRFQTRVERLYYNTQPGRRWVLESNGPGGRRVEEFDFVSVNNGHYSDPWIPKIPGLSSFPGEIIHAREYRRPGNYAGRKILVVGSGNSGSDIVRQVASLNLGHYSPDGRRLDTSDTPPHPYSTVHQSSTGANRNGYNTDTDPWSPYIYARPVIHHVEPPSTAHPRGIIHFDGAEPITDIDTIIFATGYNNSLPFCKVTDSPWKEANVLEEVIRREERVGGDEWEVGGVKGLHMAGLDELLLFLENDRSIAFIGLPYQIVPFPFSEAQARLVALLWAGQLPSFPKHPTLPRNPANPYLTPPTTPDEKDNKGTTTRFSEGIRGELIFKNPYEWSYTGYLFELMREADGGEDVPGYWKEVEGWRVERRHDTGLRKRVLGF